MEQFEQFEQFEQSELRSWPWAYWEKNIAKPRHQL